MGKYLKHINLPALVDPHFPVRSGVSNSAIIKSYLALLCQGKSDFDAIEHFRGDAFFGRALSVASVPSSPTLRQRMDTHACAWFDLASSINEALLSARPQGSPIAFGALPCGYTPLDIDTFAMDNSGTSKELVADSAVTWQTLREGKRQCLWQEALAVAGVGSHSNPLRRIYRLVERTSTNTASRCCCPAMSLRAGAPRCPRPLPLSRSSRL